ncbi:MAG: class I SAM-dependent methyltransferase [Raineya sp.]
MPTSNWFATWFNSPYYHILYKNRDENEAKIFMSNLAEYLAIPAKATILDAACGKGRHSAFLASNGFAVTGFDLASDSIAEAKKNYETLINSPFHQLDFFIHDIRKPFRNNHFDYVFNLFTSFGYFETEEENQETIKALATNLKAGGILVIDFFNTEKVVASLPQTEKKEIDGITFHIEKKLEDKFIVKNIRFEDKYFQERVMAIGYQDFLGYFEQANLQVQKCFGDYQLSDYESSNSDRMIWIVKKV